MVNICTVPESLWFFRGQAAFLQERGWAVYAVSSPGPELDRFGRQERVAVVPVEMARAITPIGDLRSLVRLVSALRSVSPQVVHCHTPKAGLLGTIAARLAGTPLIVYHLHGLPAETSKGVRRQALLWSDRIACALSHRVLAVSESLAEAAAQHHIAARSRISVLGKGSIGGVDAVRRFDASLWEEAASRIRRELKIPIDAPVVGYVGRIAGDKGIADLAAAWPLLASDFPSCYLMLVGDEEPNDPVAPQMLRTLHDHPRVKFVPRVEEPAPYFAVMQVLALPTRREGFSLVALEAAATGRPVVGAAVTGMVDPVLDGVTGLLYQPGDVNALRASLTKYLEDPPLAKTHGARGRARVLVDFQPEALWKAQHAVYAHYLTASLD